MSKPVDHTSIHPTKGETPKPLPEEGTHEGRSVSTSTKPKSKTINDYAKNALETGSKQKLSKEIKNIGKKLENSENTKKIESIRISTLSEEKSENEDAKGIMINDKFMSEEEIIALLEEFNLHNANSGNKESTLKDYSRGFALMTDKDKSTKRLVKTSSEYFKKNTNRTIAFFSKDGVETEEKNAELIKETLITGDFVCDEDLDPELYTYIMDTDLTIVLFSAADWDKHVKLVYIATLGIKIETVRHRVLEKRLEPKKQEKSTLKPSKKTIVAIKSHLKGKFQNYLIKTFFLKMHIAGSLSKELDTIAKKLLELREEQKEKLREEKQKEILSNIIKARELQKQLHSWGIKKEKIWFENTTTFLKYLLKRERKYIIFSNINRSVKFP